GAGANREGVLRAERPPRRKQGRSNSCGYRERLQVFADAGAQGADRGQVLVPDPVERVEQRVEFAARPDKVTVRRGGDTEAWGDREAGPGQLAQVRTLAADLG